MTVGDQLGPYEIRGLLGQGGMGSVYRAHDARLGREVAIKVSRVRLDARFEREARAIAALNHPNICTLHDIGAADDGASYLVMELVDGRTPQGPLPVEEVLRIAGQIADALQVAHDRGFVHRDLKPANILITASGLVKVLDFGLAKALHDQSSESTHLTAPWTAVGTPAYMSPEQAEGREVDKRCDVWAFGVVVYELLTGTRAFPGDSVQATLTAVLTREPDFSKVPARMRRLLRACLAKDPRDRLSSVSDWRLLLDNDEPADQVPAAAVRSKTPWMLAGVGTVLGLAIGAAIGSAGLFRSSPVAATPPPAVIRFDVPVPGGLPSLAQYALSPDASHLVISAPEDGVFRLYLRRLGSADARVLPGTEGARLPFWSPDGQRIAFFAESRLKTVGVAGGDLATLATVDTTLHGGTWGRAGTIVFSQSRQLYKVSDKGGTPTFLYRAPQILRLPWFLPDGRRFLFGADGAGISAGDIDGSAPRQLLENATRPMWSDGHLLFDRQGRLMAQPFDAETLNALGSAIPASEDALALGETSTAFSVTADGMLASLQLLLERLTWVNRNGIAQETVGPARSGFGSFRLSPDRTRLGLGVSVDSGNIDFALLDIRRGTLERMTTHARADLVPVFSPDGRTIAFTSNRTGKFDPYVTTGVNQERLLTDLETTGGYPSDWSPDGKHLLYWADEDIWIVPTAAGEKPSKYTESPGNEVGAMFSPDGRWVAYASNESGRYELYLEPFPARKGVRHTVSDQGGFAPAWRADGKELFYVNLTGRLMAVPVTLGAEPELGRSETLFPGFVATPIFNRSYEVSPDGQRFLVARPAEGPNRGIAVVTNWRRALEH